jgi:predicted nucleotidyltransferase
MDIHELARQNQQSAWKVLEDTCIIEAWERIGATVHLVGSLRTGLLAKSRDIDIHIYTDRLDVGESFSVIRELAERLPLHNIGTLSIRRKSAWSGMLYIRIENRILGSLI